MNMRITPHPLRGSIKAVTSKSDAHRCLMAAALADKPTLLELEELSQDIEATMLALQAWGAKMEKQEDGFIVHPIQPPESAQVDCVESGSTLRFLVPIAATLQTQTTFIGRGRLPQRPLHDLLSCLVEKGAKVEGETLPLTIMGGLQSGEYALPGHISSQYVTGLLYALPLLSGDSRIILTTPLQSVGYVDMTVDVLSRFGIQIVIEENGYYIPGNQQYRSPGKVVVERDWSGAAFFLLAGALSGGDVQVEGLLSSSKQRDREFVECLRQFGADVMESNGNVGVKSAPMKGIHCDLGHIPDLLPCLAVAAGAAEGETLFYNGARLRLKESDRLESVQQILLSQRVSATVTSDSLSVTGGQFAGGVVDSYDDHRIAMAGAIAASYATHESIILGAECSNKSYPGFWKDFQSLGGICDVVHHG